MSAKFSMEELLAHFEAQMAFHKTQEAHHAEQEAFHRERKELHTAEHDRLSPETPARCKPRHAFSRDIASALPRRAGVPGDETLSAEIRQRCGHRLSVREMGHLPGLWDIASGDTAAL